MAQKRRSFSPFGPQGRAPAGPEATGPKPSVDEATSDFAGVVGGKPAASHDSDDDAVFGTEPPHRKGTRTDRSAEIGRQMVGGAGCRHRIRARAGIPGTGSRPFGETGGHP